MDTVSAPSREQKIQSVCVKSSESRNLELVIVDYTRKYNLVRWCLSLNIEDSIRENQSLVHHTINRYFSSLRDDEDIYQAGMIGLWKACLHFDESKGYKFSTFAVKCIYRSILIELRSRRNTNLLNCISLDNPVDEECHTHVELMEDPDDAFSLIELRETLNSLSDKERNLLELRYEGLTYKEIGEILGISKSRVGVLIQQLRDKLESM